MTLNKKNQELKIDQNSSREYQILSREMVENFKFNNLYMKKSNWQRKIKKFLQKSMLN